MHWKNHCNKFCAGQKDGTLPLFFLAIKVTKNYNLKNNKFYFYNLNKLVSKTLFQQFMASLKKPLKLNKGNFNFLSKNVLPDHDHMVFITNVFHIQKT